jgi:hypothetical protein
MYRKHHSIIFGNPALLIVMPYPILGVGLVGDIQRVESRFDVGNGLGQVRKHDNLVCVARRLIKDSSLVPNSAFSFLQQIEGRLAIAIRQPPPCAQRSHNVFL